MAPGQSRAGRSARHEAEALAGCPAELSTHPADRAADHEATRLLLAGECDSYTAEKRVLGAGDEPRWVLATVTALPVDPGMPPRYHVAFEDIGDRKRVEHELRGREERFRLAAEATQDAVWDWDLLTDRIAWDEPGARHLRLPARDAREYGGMVVRAAPLRRP